MVTQHLLLMFAILSSIPSSHGQQRTNTTTWDYFVVSTPDFVGPFRGNDSTFQAPVASDVAKPVVESSRNGVIAVLEVIVNQDGSTKFERMLRAAGSRAGRRIREVVNRWHFEPARLDGQAIRVRLRVIVTAVRAQPPVSMTEDVVRMVRAAHELKSLMPWSGPVPEIDAVVRHGKAVVPRLMILLPDDPDDPNLTYEHWHEQDILAGKQFDWSVEQQAATALCRIYEVSEPDCPRYDSRATREANKKVRAFWLKTIAESR